MKALAYSVTHQSAFKRKLKKLPAEVLAEVLDNVAPQIVANPAAGSELIGNWKPFRAFHFHRKPEYRLIYRLYDCRSLDNPPTCDLLDHTACDPMLEDCSGLIDFVLIGTREEFNRYYKLSRKEINGYILEA